jgi:hypothetical protein
VIEVLADNMITPDESEKVTKALNAACAVMDKQSEREDAIKVEYEQKLKDKDALIVKLMGVYASAVIGQVMVSMGILGVNPQVFWLMLASIGIQIGMGIVYFVLKEKAPAILNVIRKGTDIVKPLLPVEVQQGIDTIKKVIDETKVV